MWMGTGCCRCDPAFDPHRSDMLWYDALRCSVTPTMIDMEEHAWREKPQEGNKTSSLFLIAPDPSLGPAFQGLPSWILIVSVAALSGINAAQVVEPRAIALVQLPILSTLPQQIQVPTIAKICHLSNLKAQSMEPYGEHLCTTTGYCTSVEGAWDQVAGAKEDQNAANMQKGRGLSIIKPSACKIRQDA